MQQDREIIDGLHTGMTFAVYALEREFGPVDGQHAQVSPYYALLRKPAFEASAMLSVMRDEWGATVFPVCPTLETVAGSRCFPNLQSIPEPVDCVISLLPTRVSSAAKEALISAHHYLTRRDYRPMWSAQALAIEMRQAGISRLWRAFGPFFNPLTSDEHACYRSAGIIVTTGCPLLHWDLSSLPMKERALHACAIHGIGSRKVPRGSGDLHSSG